MSAGGKWYDVDAYGDQKTAEAMAEVARQRASVTDWRVVVWKPLKGGQGYVEGVEGPIPQADPDAE
jgi:hypothetical protein